MGRHRPTPSQVGAPFDPLPQDWAILGLVAEGSAHGFAISQVMGPGGALGRIWTVARPAVYQSLNKLQRQGWIREQRTVASVRGPRRTLLAVTPEGARALRRWLAEPVGRARAVRSELLLKLALLDRSGKSSRKLLDAQRKAFEPRMDMLRRELDRSEGFERVVLMWRLQSTQSVLDFVDSIVGVASAGDP